MPSVLGVCSKLRPSVHRVDNFMAHFFLKKNVHGWMVPRAGVGAKVHSGGGNWRMILESTGSISGACTASTRRISRFCTADTVYSGLCTAHTPSTRSV